ncbi:probable sporulation protein, polysaccharide deacetylase family [Propionispora vibrioides]|uniref:Probable sporulation protein, polysaccharide deacetylase family n=2 Tax=Propionispora vibrioides TaxID=112903 RepID=A0A1H8SMF1_9FIRM|nr:probable sporulation protein, polysaccharide deacetylase family [Propionispora vibrioides]
MRWMVVARVRQWYIFFAAGVFLVLAALAGFLQPMLSTVKPAGQAEAIFHGDEQQPKVAFACNVFWGEEFLPDMLKTLDDNQIKITFFIGGSWAKRFPDTLADIGKRGHELGNHTYSHPHPNSLSKEKNQEEITRAENLVKEITGIKTTLYAPPYGEYNDMVLQAASELGYRNILWSIDTVDWKRPAPEIITARVVKKIHNGAIILMHPTAPTAAALPTLIKELKERGYTITTVSDILK